MAAGENIRQFNLPDSEIRTIISFDPDGGYPTGIGWCRFESGNGDVYEGFVQNGKSNGMGCFLHRDGTFSAGFWLDDKLIKGRLHKSDGTVPLQFQSKTRENQNVRRIARMLSAREDVTTEPTVLASAIVEMNMERVHGLALESELESHTILFLPAEHLDSMQVSTPVSSPAAISRNDNHPGPLDFLIGAIVEVHRPIS